MDNNTIKTVVLNLTGLEIFFILTTILALFLNLYQLMLSIKEKATLHAPLSNSLIALFNDVKSKKTSVFETEQFLFHKQNPHKDIDTLRWEYFQFTKNVNNFLNGFQENIVGALVTLNPEDKRGEKVFNAADYGLTEAEKEFKRTYFANHQLKQEKDITPQKENSQSN